MTQQQPTPLILVVDDDADVRDTAREMLQTLGYGALMAPDGPAALRMLADHPSVAVLFTDVMMPGGLTGFALAREARQFCPDLKVLYATGYADEAVQRHHPAVEAPLLRKPYRLNDLAREVERIIGEPPSG
jgi:CheY-like chemotaxis protein